MATNVSIDEAQTKQRDIIARLAPDEEIIITENQQPVATLVGKPKQQQQRPRPGLCKGMITIVADDDEHLDDFQEYMP